ncbi:hypothetical protein T492DRAFT_927712 [Pavlovales sp. CCMP2436]|nr:hypothetical protein T492DRAFT_927712 [Pavlovales sp. CCMP2436]
MQPAEPVQVSEPPYIIKSLLPPPLLQSAEPIQTSHAAGRKTAKLFLALPYEERLDLIRAARTSAGLVTGSLDFDCRTAQASVHVDKLMILQHIVDKYIAVKIRDRNRPDGKPNDLGQHASTAIASAAHGPVVRTASPLSQGVLPSSAPGRPKLRKWMPGRRVRPAPA